MSQRSFTRANYSDSYISLFSRYFTSYSICILTGEWMSCIQFPERDTDFPPFYQFQIGFGAHPASCPKGTGSSFPGG